MYALASPLSAQDPSPVETLRAQAARPLVLACSHAGSALPEQLSARAPAPEHMAGHIAHDIGAAGVVRALSQRLGAVAVLQRYSRLVIDCDRARHARDLVPRMVDGTHVPFNDGLVPATIDARWQAIHVPFHDAIAAARAARLRPAFVAVHSFAPRLGVGLRFNMDLGLVARIDHGLAERLAAALSARAPGLVVARDGPEPLDDDEITMARHGEGPRLPHILLSIRNDLIARPSGQLRLGAVLADALDDALY